MLSKCTNEAQYQLHALSNVPEKKRPDTRPDVPDYADAALHASHDKTAQAFHRARKR